jgi:hypothetical protein
MSFKPAESEDKKLSSCCVGYGRYLGKRVAQGPAYGRQVQHHKFVRSIRNQVIEGLKAK